MTTIKGYMGVALILLGALLLIVSYIAGWTSRNLVLLLGLILIILGAFMHIKHLKGDGKY